MMFICKNHSYAEIIGYFSLQRYEEWRDGLPDFKWLDDVLPDTEQWNKYSNNLKSITNSVRDSIEIGDCHV